MTDSAAIPPPNACRWCGLEQRGHYQRITATADRHPWTAPTDAQRLERMLARRAQRLAPKAPYAPPPPEIIHVALVDVGPFLRALEAAAETLGLCADEWRCPAGVAGAELRAHP
jgi:hypothetical protein